MMLVTPAHHGWPTLSPAAERIHIDERGDVVGLS
jgi:hypothetical protein